MFSNNTIEEVFERVAHQVLDKLRHKVSFPREIIWITGPSKSGRTTVANFVSKNRQHSRSPLSLQFRGGEFADWLEKLLFELVHLKSRDGIVVDDYFAFPERSVKSLPFIHKFFCQIRAGKGKRNRNNLPFTRFRFIVLSCDSEILASREVSSGGEHDLGKMDREVTTCNTVQNTLLENFHFTPIDTGTNGTEVVEAQVLNELDDTENGKPKKYNVTKLTFQGNHQLPMNRHGNLQRYNSSPAFGYGNKGMHRNYSNKGPGDRGTPRGTPRNYSSNWRQNSNDYGNHGLLSPHEQHYGGSSPQNSYYNTMSPGFAPSPRFTFPEDQRHLGRSQSYNVGSGTPRSPGPSGPIPTSCRLRDMAENDRHSFFPSSSRSNYKSVTHPGSQVYSPGGNLQQMSMGPIESPALVPHHSASLHHRMSIKSTDSSKIRDVFLQICAELEAEHGKENLIYPREIIWMIGPPGAGKSTLSRFLSEQRQFNSTPIVLREICQSVIAQNDGKLKIDEVVASLMKKLFCGDYGDGVVVDGFVSITCARVVPFMFKYFHEIYDISQKSTHPPCFKFCVLYVNEDNSVRRQIVNYETGEKKSDKKFDAEEGRKLYRKFLKRTQQVVELIEMHFSFHLIDANGTLAQVQMVASTEIASDSNGALIHDATLVKALSPAANPKRRNSKWNRNNSGRTNSFRSNSMRANSYRGGGIFRSNSTRSHSHVNISQSPRNNSHKATDFRLTPKSHQVQFANNLSVDITSNLEQVDDRDTLQGLRQAVLDIVYGNDDASSKPANKLPAQKMETLNNQNYEQLISDYVVRPYVKGTHAMLYWSASGACYLIDRRFQFFTIRGNAYTAAHVGEGLIDGVLVVDSEDNIVFVAHDCATHQSRRLKDCWFTQRVHECRTIVGQLNEEKNGDETVHLVFLESMAMSNINDLIGMIDLREDGNGRTLELGGRQIPTHGFSFVPEKTGFHSPTGSRTFTWNFLEDTSRDFKVKKPFDSNQVVLYASSKNADTVFQRAQFPEADQERFEAIVAEAITADLNDSFIVSCQFSKTEELWIPKKLQPNKARANSTNSVNDSTVAWQNRLDLDFINTYWCIRNISLNAFPV